MQEVKTVELVIVLPNVVHKYATKEGPNYSKADYEKVLQITSTDQNFQVLINDSTLITWVAANVSGFQEKFANVKESQQ